MVPRSRGAGTGILLGIAAASCLACSSASDVVIGANLPSPGVPDAGHGDEARRPLPDATVGGDAKADSSSPRDARRHDAGDPIDGHADARDAPLRTDAEKVDAGVDAGHDTGVDAPLPCAAALDAGGAAGTFDQSFQNGDKGDLIAATPGGVLVDALDRVYVIGQEVDCVTSGSLADFAVSRFTSDGALDDSYGVNGTACVDFIGGEDSALGAAFDAAGNVVLVGYSTESPTALGDASASALLTTASLGVARLTPAGVLDTTFGNAGKVRPTLEAFDGSCSVGSGCAPPEVQQGNVVAFDAAFTHMYVGGTTQSYPAGGPFYTAGFVAAFNVDGSIDVGFNPSGAHPDAAYGAPGYLTDDGLVSVTGALVDGTSLYVLGTDKGAPVDGGFANAARRLVTRRYLAMTGVLDPSWNPSGPVAGEVRTVIGTNDFASSLLVEPTGEVVVAGVASVGGGAITAGAFGGGFVGAVRFSSGGALDITFGSGGIFVSSTVMSFPAYERSVLVRQCDGRLLLGGFVGTVDGCEGASNIGCQSLAVMRLAPNGAPDPTYGTGDAGTAVIAQAFPGTNAITDALVLDSDQDLIVLGGDQGGNIVFERVLH